MASLLTTSPGILNQNPEPQLPQCAASIQNWNFLGSFNFENQTL